MKGLAPKLGCLSACGALLIATVLVALYLKEQPHAYPTSQPTKVLTVQPRPLATPTPSVTTDLLAYISGGNLWIFSPDGSASMQLTHLQDTAVADFAWSPDGRKLAYVEQDNISKSTALWIINADGSRNKRIASLQPESYQWYFEWSSDANSLAFVDTNGYLWVYHEQGDKLVPIAGPGASWFAGPAAPFYRNASWGPDWIVDRNALWSPDNTAIVFTMQKQNRFGLYVAKIDTGVVLEVLPDPPYDAPVWSPDSRKLAVSTRRWVSVDVSEPGCSGPREEITYYIFDVESGQLVEVTRGYLVGTGTFWLANNSVVFRFEKAPCAGGYFYRFGADGRNGVRLGEKGMCCSEGFSLAPNKETIAYWSYVFGQKKGENYVELYTVDTRHLTWRLVLRVPEDTVLSASAVIWLPSRNMVAFELDQSVWSGSRTVCVADLQTGTFYQIAGDYSTLKPFVNDLYYATVEAVAPSEQWIVIRGSKQAKAGRLYLFNLDEDKLIDVAPGLFYDSVDWKVEWAPSARRFAFSGREIDGQEQNVYNVYIVDTTGRVSRTIRNVGVYSWGWAPR